jgi:hypothetical protein
MLSVPVVEVGLCGFMQEIKQPSVRLDVCRKNAVPSHRVVIS